MLGERLILSGRLPTFYLKQLLQETVRHLPGVQHVRNEIDVATTVDSAHGDWIDRSSLRWSSPGTKR